MKYSPIGAGMSASTTRHWVVGICLLLMLGALGYLIYWLIPSSSNPAAVETGSDTFQLKLQGNLSAVTNQTALSDDIRLAIATELGISIDQVVVTKLEAGSIIATIKILASSSTSIVPPPVLIQQFLSRVIDRFDRIHNETVFMQFPILYTPPPDALNVTFVPRSELERDYATWAGITARQYANQTYADEGDTGVKQFVIAQQYVNQSELEAAVNGLGGATIDLGAVDTTINITVNNETAALVVTNGWVELDTNPTTSGTDNMLLIDPLTHVIKEGKAPSTPFKASVSGSDSIWTSLNQGFQPTNMANVNYDPLGSWLYAQSGPYTVPVSGIYLINYSIRIPSTTGTWDYDVQFTVDGQPAATNSFYHVAYNTTTTKYNSFEMNRQLAMNQAQQFRVLVAKHGVVNTHVDIALGDENLQIHILSTI